MTWVMNRRIKTKICYSVMSLSLLMGWANVVLAESPAIPANTTSPSSSVSNAGGMGQQPGGLMAFTPLILMFGVFYFLILRPQQKKMKEQQSMIAALKHGDEIVTASGILGKVTGITDKVVTVEVADNVRVKMMKSQVSQVVKGSIKDLAQ